MSDSDDKTEAPSSQRLQKAREDGQIVMSREAMNFVALLGGFAGIFMVLPYLVTDFIHVMQVLMANAGTLPMTQGGLLHSTDHAIAAGLKLAVPMAASVAALCLGGGFLQTGFLIHPESLLPKFERISPLAGFKRIAGGGTLPDTFKALAKFTIFAVVLWNISKNVIPSVPRMVGLEPAPLLKIISDLGFKAASAMILAQLVIAGFDIFWMRFRHISKLKMSREDLKDEYKNTEGDPHVKGRQKALRAKAARQRMMAAVKTATVVVTNPTHYAVALVYERGGGGAPRIVAKGMDDVAARIRDIAQDNRIPLVTNPPLARALFTLPLESEIPAEHFKVVAAIIAYVWKLKRPASRSAPLR
ncbi:EscU/YscU/HrcU family type III secretion system export apparatus switch protein [Gluconobacter sphaericus]|uniref:Flagellar biosynthesis protein FlhB n=1 Tax=Gluconobacter sphaericus NBRC 12467 TaxID=1307951 RepID=A0AA37W9V7_9PROT|nr:EscU/YscU/HrcU family type III secretion system export apparatus switch protein [Gluconobacter sphaericus]MBF0884754.1 EscU/YscU/HrcU family type III secretion system export apparatus switch protein [Gluconobacter sphaericus]MBS1085755.1 EscU/YscU/HrcU family type III secretion system export apparatus switch protein [Gluconobacter sphaericus]MBS1100866.1 EscU/YscU/HrcU family type III secretion system export apparatus switch protein [Gluconobacter sphaericus]GBR53964.1 flagellar biosynthetic